jgi:membrane associated rhomboid family serine protease
MTRLTAVPGRWRTLVQRTGAPTATALAALAVAVTAIQYVVLPSVGVPADGTLQYRLLHFDTAHPYRVWTLVTSVVAHDGFLHVAINAHLLIGFGSIIEPEDGTRSFLLAVVAGATGAHAAAILLDAALAATGGYVGASGAAFGLLGWLSGHSPRRRLPTIPPAPAWVVTIFVTAASIIAVAVFGVGAFGIGHVPHVGAVVAGAAVGCLSR